VTTASFDQPFSQYPIDALQDSDRLDTISSSEATTLDELFRERVRRSSDQLAYTQFDEAKQSWTGYSWADVAAQVARYQVAMTQAGLNKGDRVAIGLDNSVEWIVFDQAALRLGLVVVPLYVSDRADNMAYVIQNSGAKLLFVQSSQVWLDISAADEDTACVEHVIILSGDAQAECQLVDHWLPEFGEHMERGMAEPDDLASIVYTSGTTGRPKGVMLSHKNMLSNAYTGMRSVALTPQDRLLSFLPLSHTLERTVGYYASLMSGCQVVFNRSIKQLSDDLVIVKPTVIIFDVNETLLDLTSMRKSVGDAIQGREDLLPLWFSTMLHHSLVVSATGEYESFGNIGVAALQMVAEINGIEITKEQAKHSILTPLRSLPAHPDVAMGLAALKAQGYKLVTLTNSSLTGVRQQLKNSNLSQYFDANLSIESVGVFKPHLSTYQWAIKELNVNTNEALMVAAHGWDIAGASKAGLQTAFIRRANKVLFPIADKPDYTVLDVNELAKRLSHYK